MKNLFGLSVFGAMCVLIFLGCSVYKSQGRKNFENDSDGRTSGELNVLTISKSIPPDGKILLKTEFQNQKNEYVFTKPDFLNLQCTTLPAHLPVACLNNEVHTILSAEIF
jgi:hypothetical protein